jgi:nucleotide-binding universal stress UspA family protein
MKNILVLIHDDEGQESRLQTALDATRALEGHLKCIHVTELIPVGGDAFDMSGGVVVLAAEQDVETKNRASVERRLAEEDVSWDMVEISGSIEPALLQEADLADLIVVNAETADQSRSRIRSLVERLAVKSRKPVLAATSASSGFRPADPVLIAWDGSDPAAAALRAAVPLLRLSERVTIYEVDEGSTNHGAEAAAEYLSRHGVSAEVVLEDAPDSDFVEPLLLSRLSTGGYGWVVMGAFSRPRLVEAIFGGVTKRLLKEAPVPLFIAH